MIDLKKDLNLTFQKSIQAFEEAFDVHICIRDFTGHLNRYIPSGKTFHDNPYCCRIKSHIYTLKLCSKFDNGLIYEHLKLNPKCFFKLCHGALLELVVPILREGNLVGMIFVGPFQWNEHNPSINEIVVSPFHGKNENLKLNNQELSGIPVLDAKLIQILPEIFQAFANHLIARLDGLDSGVMDDGNRKKRIENFLRKRFFRKTNLKDVAAYLCLSVSRTGELIKKLFGQSFTSLLQDLRIRHAKDLLTSSDLTVQEIAQHCGFSDPALFYRTFKNNTSITPREYRLTHTSESDFELT